jgi:hypothetical protein
MYKPYAEMDCPELETISAELYNFIKNSTNILADDLRAWQFTDTKLLLSTSPTLTKYFLKNKLFVKHAAFMVLYNNLDLHIDPLPVIAKINFPVLNTTGWVNRWYSLSDEQLKECPVIIDSFGQSKEDISNIPLEEMDLIAEVHDMNKVLAFHSRLPHSVTKLENATMPRIIASFTFFNEPLDLLK